MASESCLKSPKTQRSAGKVVESVFWDVHGIIYIDYLEKGKSIFSDYYIELLVLLNDEIANENRLHMKKKNHLSSGQCNMPQVNENNGQI